MLKNNFENLKPVYHISGEDNYLILQVVRQIEDACENPLGDINKAIFDDENFDAEKIIMSTEQVPMLAKKRFVLVKNILKAKEADIKKLIEYCKSPVEDTVLVFAEVAGLNVFSKISAEKIVCKKLSNQELVDIVCKEFQKHKKEISNETANLLITFCSRELMRINTEINKLAFASNDTEITIDDVKKLVHKNDDYSVFEITSALGDGNADRGIQLMKKMLEVYEFPFILSLIYSNFRRMFHIVLSDKTDAEIAKNLGVQEFAIKTVRTRAKKLKPLQIIKINELILEIDYNIKIGKMGAENAMYYLAFKMVEIIKGELKW